MIVVGVAAIGGLFINPPRGFLRKKQVPSREPSNRSMLPHYIGNLVRVPFGHLFLLSQVIISHQSPQI